MQDSQLFELVRKELFSAVLGDVMDARGLRHQFLPAPIRALEPATVLVGRAKTVLEADCASTRVGSEGKEQPFGVMFEALDSLREGEIYMCTGGSPKYALWGELMSTRARILKAEGAIVDGYHRDTRGILGLGFPLFSWGSWAQDQGVRGRVIDYDCPIEYGNGTVVEPGDLVFGDIDGVVVIPRAVEVEVIDAALEKVRGENKVREAIIGGMSTREAFDRFRIM
jgi:regulator of RNase E activity RraA